MNNRIVYDLKREPRDEVYRRLIELSLLFCDTALLVVQRNLKPPEVLEDLQPFLKKKSKETEWPGSKLTTSTATVYRFLLCSGSVRILKEAVNGLYGWQQPDRPEDLCLLRPDGSPWIVSIAHEFDSYLELTLEEKQHVLTELPELGPLIMHTAVADLLVDPSSNLNAKALHLLSGTVEEIFELRQAAEADGFHWFHMDASEIKSDTDFLNTLATAIKLPYPLEHNWDALPGYLRDFSWLRGRWYVCFIEHADSLLRKSPDTFERFLEIAVNTVNFWWERKVLFHFYLSGGVDLRSYDYSDYKGQVCFHQDYYDAM